MKVIIATVILCLTSVAASAQYTTVPNGYGGWTTTSPYGSATTNPNPYGSGYNTTVTQPYGGLNSQQLGGWGSSYGGPSGAGSSQWGSSYRR